MSTVSKLLAEFIGTFCLVFCGCGAAVLAGKEAGTLGIGLAFGLSLMAMAFSIGHISGCHLNPAVTLGLVAAKRFSGMTNIIGYIVVQVIGAVAGALVLYIIAKGQGRYVIDSVSGTFACNGYGEEGLFGGKNSLNYYSLYACFVAEMVFTGIFVFVIVGSTSSKAPVGFAPIAIGLCLAMVHLALIPITNCSLNPARSTGTALIAVAFSDHTAKTAGTSYAWPLKQLWLFWLAPLIGGVLGGLTYRFLEAEGSLIAKPKKHKQLNEFAASDDDRFDLGGAPKPKPVEVKPPEKPH